MARAIIRDVKVVLNESQHDTLCKTGKGREGYGEPELRLTLQIK